MRQSAQPPGPYVLRYLPLVGVVLGGLAFVPALLVWRGGETGAPLFAAVLVVGAMVLLTRALHLHGLARIAEALSSQLAPQAARQVMRRSDVGVFGVVALIGVEFTQVAALVAVFASSSRWGGLVAVLLAIVTGRVAVVCVSYVRPVPGGGLGSLVAGSIGPWRRAIAAGALIVAAEVAELLVGGAAGEAFAGAAAVVLGIAVGAVLTWHAARRLDGVTGNVYGAVIEVATATALVVQAAVSTWH